MDLSNSAALNIGLLVGGLTALATLANLFLQLSGRAQARRIEPQPLEVKGTPQYAMAADLERVERELGNRINGVDGDVKRLRSEIVTNGEIRRKSIEGKVESVRLELTDNINRVHGRVDDILAAVSELKGQVNKQI